MTKISNQIVYIPDLEINGLDYFIGTDYDQNKRTVNFRVEDLGSHYNITNGVRNFEYIFYEHANISPTPTDGYFYSNDNETDPNNIDYFIFSKKTARNKDVTQFFQSIISDNPFDLIVAQKTGINTIFFFRIDEIIENANYFRLNVSEVFFPENNSLSYVFGHAVFNLKSSENINAIESLSSADGSISITPSGKDRNIQVVQATESQLGGGKIVNQATIEDSTSTNDTDIVTSKKFWLGWSKGLTLNSFFSAIKNTVLTGFNSAITWARVTTSSTIEIAISLLQKQSNYLQSTRFISGTGVTINSGDSTKFDIQVIGEIVDPITFTPTSINVNLTAQTATYIGTQVESYIWINALGTVEQSLNPPLPTDYDTIIGFWVLVHSNLTNINLINSFPYYADGTAIKVAQILSFIGFSKFPNTNIATVGTTGTRIEHTGGFAIKSGLGNTTKRPVVSLIGAIDPSNMEMRHRNGVFSTGVQNIDVTNYNPTGSTVSALSNNKFSVHKIWKFASGLVRIQYGQKEYDNYNEAVAGIAADSFVDEGNAFRNGLHIGWLVFKKNTSWGIGGTGTDGQDYKFVDVKSNGSTGGLTPTLQATYDVSTQPQITTSASKGAFQVKGGTGVDTDNIWEGKNNAGAVTSYIKADGSSSFTGTVSQTVNSITSSSLTTQDIAGFITYINSVTPFTIDTNEIVDYHVTDTNQYFKILVNGVSVGSGQTAIVESQVITYDLNTMAKFKGALYLWQPIGNQISVVGAVTPTTVGTGSNATSNFSGTYTSSPALTWNRRRSVSAASAGSTAEFYEAGWHVCSVGLGFYFVAQVQSELNPSNARLFDGLTNSLTAFPNSDPSSQINLLGFGKDASDTNYHIIHNDGTGTATKVLLTGSNFLASNLDSFRIEIINLYNSNTVTFIITNLRTRGVSLVNVNSDLPSITTGLAPRLSSNNGATAASVTKSWNKLEIRTNN